MSGGGGGIQGMISTIVALKEIQQRDAAQRLAEQEFGLRVETTHEGNLANFRDLLSKTDNPTAFLKYAPHIAQATGQSEDFIQDIINRTPPSSTVIRDRKIAEGAGQVSSDVAADVALTGQTPGQLAEDQLGKAFAEGAFNAYKSLGGKDRDTFNRAIATKRGTGQSLTDAAIDAVGENLTPEAKQNILAIGKGLIPNASENAQLRMGNLRLILDQTVAQNEASARLAQLEIAKTEAATRLTGENATKALEIMKSIEALEKTGMSGSATMTPFGKDFNNAMINSNIEFLKKIDPSLAALLTPIPLGQDLGPTGVGAFFKQYFTSPAPLPAKPNP